MQLRGLWRTDLGVLGQNWGTGGQITGARAEGQIWGLGWLWGDRSGGLGADKGVGGLRGKSGGWGDPGGQTQLLASPPFASPAPMAAPALRCAPTPFLPPCLPLPLTPPAPQGCRRCCGSCSPWWRCRGGCGGGQHQGQSLHGPCAATPAPALCSATTATCPPSAPSRTRAMPSWPTWPSASAHASGAFTLEPADGSSGKWG